MTLYGLNDNCAIRLRGLSTVGEDGTVGEDCGTLRSGALPEEVGRGAPFELL